MPPWKYMVNTKAFMNSYFYPMIFINDKDKLPLQNFLRELLLVANQNTADTGTDPMAAQQLAKIRQLTRPRTALWAWRRQSRSAPG